MDQRSTKFCVNCGGQIEARAEICVKCGVRQPYKGGSGKISRRVAAAIFAMLLGSFGVHRFYLGQIGWGILYVLFCWTLIPAVAGLIEGILYLTMSDEQFAEKYGF